MLSGAFCDDYPYRFVQLPRFQRRDLMWREIRQGYRLMLLEMKKARFAPFVMLAGIVV